MLLTQTRDRHITWNIYDEIMKDDGISKVSARVIPVVGLKGKKMKYYTPFHLWMSKLYFLYRSLSLETCTARPQRGCNRKHYLFHYMLQEIPIFRCVLLFLAAENAWFYLCILKALYLFANTSDVLILW